MSMIPLRIQPNPLHLPIVSKHNLVTVEKEMTIYEYMYVDKLLSLLLFYLLYSLCSLQSGTLFSGLPFQIILAQLSFLPHNWMYFDNMFF
jgi:hypothetical protein